MTVSFQRHLPPPFQNHIHPKSEDSKRFAEDEWSADGELMCLLHSIITPHFSPSLRLFTCQMWSSDTRLPPPLSTYYTLKSCLRFVTEEKKRRIQDFWGPSPFGKPMTAKIKSTTCIILTSTWVSISLTSDLNTESDPRQTDSRWVSSSCRGHTPAHGSACHTEIFSLLFQTWKISCSCWYFPHKCHFFD